MNGDIWKRIIVTVLAAAILGYGIFSLNVWGHMAEVEAEPAYVTKELYDAGATEMNRRLSRMEVKIDLLLARQD
jgi:hypothetical protein